MLFPASATVEVSPDVNTSEIPNRTEYIQMSTAAHSIRIHLKYIRIYSNIFEYIQSSNPHRPTSYLSTQQSDHSTPRIASCSSTPMPFMYEGTHDVCARDQRSDCLL